MKKIFLILFIPLSIYADTYSFTINNDGFVSKQDSHYTNGLFFTWMQDENSSIKLNFLNSLKTNSAISFSHFMFTPKNKHKSTPILNDIPYAGYAKLNLLLYKWKKSYFHEFGVNIGAVGPITKAKELQNSFHLLMGHGKSKGWDTQLGNRAMVGISYAFGKKTNKISIGKYKFNWTNSLKGDAGTFYSGILGSSMIRFGTNFPDTFNSITSFIGENESRLLNFKAGKNFNWAIDFGLFANKVFNYYIVDEARNEGYKIPRIDYITGGEISFNIFYKNMQFTFKIKSIYLNGFYSNTHKEWGGFSIVWKYR